MISMHCRQHQGLFFVSLFILLGMLPICDAQTTDGSPLTYWYTGSSFDLNETDDWIPYFSLTDVPYSLPLRGFNSDTRNYFFDFGAHHWLSEWVENIYGWPVPEQEKGIDVANISEQMEFLFEMITSRLEKPHSYVDEARNHTALDYIKNDFNQLVLLGLLTSSEDLLELEQQMGGNPRAKYDTDEMNDKIQNNADSLPDYAIRLIRLMNFFGKRLLT